MTPVFPRDYLRDSATVNPELRSDDALKYPGRCKPPNFNNLFRRYLRSRVGASFEARVPSLRSAVGHIVFTGTQPKMGRVDAQHHVASVTNELTSGDNPAKQAVGNPMRSILFAVLRRKGAISPSACSSCPEPAPIGHIDVAHEPLEQRSVRAGKRSYGKVRFSHGEPPTQVPVVRLGLSATTLGRAAFIVTEKEVQCG